jgi:hypothetical protein
MKRLLFLVLLCASSAFGQSTTVSGTINDTNGQAFFFGTYKVQFFTNGLPTPFFWDGTAFDPNTLFTGALDSTGSFAGVVIPSSNFITPVGTAWRFTVCSAATTQCYTQNVSVTGTTMNVTGLIVPPAITVNANQFSQPAAYTDDEIQGPILGFTYYNLTRNFPPNPNPTLRLCTGSLPCTWVDIGGGGGGGTGTVTSFSSGDLPPLFTTSVSTATTTPSLAFILTNAAAHTMFANCTGSTGAPSFTLISSCVPGGTVTSVTETVPTQLLVSGGSTQTITSTGTFALTLNSPQGNGAKLQLSTGTTTTNDCVKFDANGNTVDAGAACGAGSLIGVPIALENCTGDTSGGVFWTRQPLTVTGGSGTFIDGHWEWSNTAVAPTPPFFLNCKFQLPHTLPSGSPNLILAFAINDSTAGHTAVFETCDAIVNAGAINGSTFTCTATQTVTTTTTAYQRIVKTFAVQSTVVADQLLEIQIEMVSSTSLAADVIMDGAYLEF